MPTRGTDDQPNHLGTTTPLSRRRLLHLGAAATAGIWLAGNTGQPARAATPNGAATPNDFAAVRTRWRELLLGDDTLDPDMPEVRAVLGTLDRAVERHLPTMDRSAGRTYLWPDRDFTGTVESQAIDLGNTYVRLRQLTQAYATRGTARYGDPELLDAVVDGLDWMNEHKYYDEVVRYGNWWQWEIGVPQALLPTTLLLFDQLDGGRIDSYMRAVDFQTSEPSMKGANLIWTSQIVAQRGALVEDDAKLVLARDAVPGALQILTEGNGFYPDGSFIQHSHHPYTGGYGKALLKATSQMLYQLAGTPWELGGQGLENLLTWTTEGFEPWLHKGALLEPVRGRSIARSRDSDRDTGLDAVRVLMWLAHSADDERAAHLRGIVKHTIEVSRSGNIYDTSELGSIVGLARIANDPDIVPAVPEFRTRQYHYMDRTLHRRPGFTFALAMSSARIYTYESINKENLRGWHTGSGVQYLYNDDQTHYEDGYWATVDHNRLPGTTVPVGLREPGSGADYLSDKNRVGGVAVGTLGVSGMEFRTFSGTDPSAAPTGKKSWFLFDDRIVALGAGITSSSGQVVESIAENRRLLDPDQRFVLDGTDQGTDPVERAVDNPGWAHLAGSTATSGIGYVFGDGNTLHVKRESRKGSWADVNKNPNYVDDTPIIRDYLTLWFDHGTDPTDASYAYTLLPGVDAEAARRYASRPDIEVITNTPAVQAVRRGGTLGANFWQADAPSVNGVRCQGSAAVLIVQEGRRLTVAASDPTHGAALVDNSSAELVPAGSWRTSKHLTDYFGRDYAFSEPGEGAPVARWNPGAVDPGTYAVQVWLPNGDDSRSADVSYRVHHGGQVTTFSINQQSAGGAWVTGIDGLQFAGDGDEYVELVVNDAEPSGADRTWVVADAVRLVRVRTNEGTVRLTVPRSAGRVIAKDDRVHVENLRPAITLSVDLTGPRGGSAEATFELGRH